jgi:DNA-binding SARP family transcriptional activator
MFRVYLFREFQIEDLDGNPIKIGTRKAQLLFAYLLLHANQPIPREKLVDLFWPDAEESKARQSVRQALYTLRNVLKKSSGLDTEYVTTDLQNIRFELQDHFEVDALKFDEQLAQADEEELGRSTELLECAIECYRGEILQGAYEDWTFEFQEYYRNRYLKALKQLIEIYFQSKKSEEAIEIAKKSLTSDPYQEEVHRMLIMLYVAVGNRTAALRQYEECAELLRSELDVEPLPETRALYEEIKNRSAENIISSLAPSSQSPIAAFADLGSPFVNRVSELESLSGAWTQVINQEGQAIFIAGEAGVGKTRLIREFELYGAQEDAISMSCRCFELEGSMPFQPITEAIRDGLPSLMDEQLHTMPSSALSEIISLIPSLAGLFPEIQPHSPLASPDEERRRMFENIRTFFSEVAKHRPLILFVDDLQWADESTLGFVHYLIRHLPGERILLLGAYREEEIHDLHPLRELIDHFTKEKAILSIALKPLANEHSAELVAGILNSELSETLHQNIVSASHGIPFYVEEIVKSSIESGVLKQDESGAWDSESSRIATDSIPSSIEALVKTRLRRLSMAGRQVLELLSVSTQGVSAKILRETMLGGESHFFESVEEISRSRFIDDDSSIYRFRHDLLRQVVYHDLIAEKRRHLHSQLADSMERGFMEHGRIHDEDVVVELAFHCYEAERWKRALAYLLEGGELVWEKRYAKEESLKLFRQALEVAEELDNQTGIMRSYKGIGRVCATTDEQDKGLKYCEQALELATEPEDRAEIYSSIASVYHNKRNMEMGLQYCEKALDEIGRDSKSLLAAKMYQQAASFLNWMREFDKAVEYAKRSIELLESLSQTGLLAQSYSYLGQAYSGKEDFENAVSILEKATKLAEEIGDLYSIGLAYFQLGLTFNDAGKSFESIISWERCRHELEKLSGRNEDLSAINSRLAQANMQLGDTKSALVAGNRCLEHAEKSGNLKTVSFSCGILGVINDVLGESKLSKFYFDRALAIDAHNDLMFFNIILSYIYLKDNVKALTWFDRGLPDLKPRDIEQLENEFRRV